MTYQIAIGWCGWDCVVGVIPKETAGYIKKECGGDGSTYAEKLDAGEVPEKFRLAEYSDDFEVADSFFTMYGPNCESCVNVYGDGLPEDGLEIDAVELTSETVDTHIASDKPYFVWAHEQKGSWSAVVTTDKPFDRSKLKLHVHRVWYNNDASDASLITGIVYDGEYHDVILDTSRGAGYSLEFFSA